MVDRAVDYWHNAAQLALARSAAAEAIDQLPRSGGPAEPARGARARPARTRFAGCAGRRIARAKGWGSPEMGRAYTRAYELCQAVDDVRQRVLPLWGFSFSREGAPSSTRARAGTGAAALGQAQEDVAVKLLVTGWSETSGFPCKLRCRAPFRRSDRNYDPTKHSSPIHVPSLRVMAGRALSLGHCCSRVYRIERPRKQNKRLTEARELGQRHSLAFGLHVNCLFHQVRGTQRWSRSAPRPWSHSPQSGATLTFMRRDILPTAGHAPPAASATRALRKCIVVWQRSRPEERRSRCPTSACLGRHMARARRPLEALPLLRTRSIASKSWRALVRGGVASPQGRGRALPERAR